MKGSPLLDRRKARKDSCCPLAPVFPACPDLGGGALSSSGTIAWLLSPFLPNLVRLGVSDVSDAVSEPSKAAQGHRRHSQFWCFL